MIKKFMQLGPWKLGAARFTGFRRGRRWGWPGKGRGMAFFHLELDSRGLDGTEQWSVRSSAVPGHGGCGEPCSGKERGGA
jgi:hypothetical protein